MEPKRRAHPTFFLPAEPPTSGLEWEEKTFRQHIEDWNKVTVGDGNSFPYVVYVFVLLKTVAHFAVFYFWVMDPRYDLFDEHNFKRVLLYTVIGDALGLNATSGPLGFRMKMVFVTWYNMITPGTLTCPLIPGMRWKRRLPQCVGFVIYVALLVRTLLADEISHREMLPVVVVFAVLSAFDFVTFQASRGEHSGYMMMCLLLPWPQALACCQLVQVALWFWAGVAKHTCCACYPSVRCTGTFLATCGRVVSWSYWRLEG